MTAARFAHMKILVFGIVFCFLRASEKRVGFFYPKNLKPLKPCLIEFGMLAINMNNPPNP